MKIGVNRSFTAVGRAAREGGSGVGGCHHDGWGRHAGGNLIRWCVSTPQQHDPIITLSPSRSNTSSVRSVTCMHALLLTPARIHKGVRGMGELNHDRERVGRPSLALSRPILSEEHCEQHDPIITLSPSRSNVLGAICHMHARTVTYSCAHIQGRSRHGRVEPRPGASGATKSRLVTSDTQRGTL